MKKKGIKEIEGSEQTAAKLPIEDGKWKTSEETIVATLVFLYVESSKYIYDKRWSLQQEIGLIQGCLVQNSTQFPQFFLKY